MASAALPLTASESTSIRAEPINMSTIARDNSDDEYTTADEESSNPTSPVPYITRTGKPIRSCPASAFLVQFQRSVPDTTKCTFAVRATPESTLSPYASGVRSPVTEGTPDSNYGPHPTPINVTANLTAASAYLRDFMLPDEDSNEPEASMSNAQSPPLLRSKTVDLVVPRPVVAAAAVDQLGKQVEEAEMQKIKERRADCSANTDGASSSETTTDGEKVRSRSGTVSVAVSS